MFGKLGDMAKLTKQAMGMQKEMKKLQEVLANTEVSGVCEGGLVEVIASGDMIIKKVNINPNCLHPSSVDLLNGLIQSATNNALFAAKKMAQDHTAELTKGIDIPGLGL